MAKRGEALAKSGKGNFNPVASLDDENVPYLDTEFLQTEQVEKHEHSLRKDESRQPENVESTIMYNKKDSDKKGDGE